MPHGGYSRTVISMEGDSSDESFVEEEVIAINSVSFTLRAALEEYVLVNDDDLSDEEIFVLMRFHEELTNETLLSDESYNEQVDNGLGKNYFYSDSPKYWGILVEGLKSLSSKTEEEYSNIVRDSLLNEFSLYHFNDEKFFLDELSGKNGRELLFVVTEIIAEEMKKQDFDSIEEYPISFPNRCLVKKRVNDY